MADPVLAAVLGLRAEVEEVERLVERLDRRTGNDRRAREVRIIYGAEADPLSPATLRDGAPVVVWNGDGRAKRGRLRRLGSSWAVVVDPAHDETYAARMKAEAARLGFDPCRWDRYDPEDYDDEDTR